MEAEWYVAERSSSHSHCNASDSYQLLSECTRIRSLSASTHTDVEAGESLPAFAKCILSASMETASYSPCIHSGKRHGANLYWFSSERHCSLCLMDPYQKEQVIALTFTELVHLQRIPAVHIQPAACGIVSEVEIRDVLGLDQ